MYVRRYVTRDVLVRYKPHQNKTNGHLYHIQLANIVGCTICVLFKT